ncbi:AMP-binding enzyme, partial [Burkholderia sp. LK4]
GEIETQLALHPGVRDVAVIAREDSPGDRRLVAYLCTRDDSPVDIEALRTHLRGHLPEYMVPAAFVWMEQLPLTPNGKLDRRALPAPDLSALQVREYEAPVGDTEQAIARIWAALLNVEQVG